MKMFPTLLLLFTFFHAIHAQETSDREAVSALIIELFDGMRAGDSNRLRPLFHPEARLQTTFTDPEGNPRVMGGGVDQFITTVGSPHERVFDERIWHMDIHIEDNLATAWTEYTFFLGEQLSHCGVNAFQMVRTEEGWQILQITDTRSKTGCREEPPQQEKAISELLDQWHEAAATADEETYFGLMEKDAVFLGTDPSERWLRDEFENWSAEYFAKDVAWAFTPSNRRIYFSPDGQMAWFEEDLDTWMGTCRGSGVLRFSDGEWKIAHYNLALLLPNDKMEGFKALWGKD